MTEPFIAQRGPLFTTRYDRYVCLSYTDETDIASKWTTSKWEYERNAMRNFLGVFVTEEEAELREGRFANYCPEILHVDCSLTMPPNPTWGDWFQNQFDTMAQMDCPWSFRMVRISMGRLRPWRTTFSFLNDLDAVEFRLRVS